MRAIRNGHVIRTEGESLEKYHLVSAEAEAFLSPRFKFPFVKRTYLVGG